MCGFRRAVLPSSPQPLPCADLSAGLKGVTVQLTNSDITQTDMLNLSGESAKECVTRTRGYRILAGWRNTAWIRAGACRGE